MKVIVLSDQTEIDGKIYRAGEVVQVDDNFSTNIRRVLMTTNPPQPEEADDTPKPIP